MLAKYIGGILMEIKNEASNIPITSSEIAYLWNTYLLNSLAKHRLMYAIAQCEDEDIRSIFQISLDSSTQILDQVKAIFDRENQRVPYGFSEDDVYVNAPKVYSDKLVLYVLKVYTTVGLSNYGMALSLSPRKDIRKLFTESMISTIDLSNKIDDVALEKGIYIRTPTIPTTQEVEFAEDKSIMGRIIGHKRSLNALEITNIFNCSMTSSIIAAHILGLAQTIKEERLRDFLNRTRKTLKEHYDTLNEILHKEDLSFATSLENEVFKTSEPTLSDRLSMFFSISSLQMLLTTLSIAKVGVLRKDVFMTLSQLSSEVILLIKDAADLMLERNWFEEMPKNVSREDIINS